MIKKILLFIGCFMLWLTLARPVVSQTVPISGTSAGLNINKEEKKDLRVKRIRDFLEDYKSPLLSHAEYIIEISDRYGIPWTMLVSIAGVESTFCRFAPTRSYNCWGWNNGKTRFRDYRDGIETVARALKFSYFNRGLNTSEKIGRIYAPLTPKWSRKVRYFTSQLENHNPVK